MNNNNQSLSSDIILVISGIITLIIAYFKVTTINIYFPIIMFVFGIAEIIYFLTINKSKSLQLGICNIIIGWLIIIFKNNPLILSFGLLSWLTLVSFIKLSKIDSLYNLKNSYWIMYSLNFLIFLTLGILTSVYFYYLDINKLFLLGHFYLTIGVLELIIHINYLKNK